jgi:uroporphyrin-III C-methyltransferase/precorrin-2 dehydrogenase/sirohydrochlorin ferrochelatase
LIPGISAGQAAGASLGVSLTERQLARRVQFVTAHGADGKVPSDIDWSAIADAQATTIVYMPRRNIDEFVSRAQSAGLSRSTPAALVASASLPGEQQVFGAVSDLPRLVQTLDAASPITIIIGQVARERSAAPAATRAAA